MREAFRQIELEQGEASEKYFHDVLQRAKDSNKLPPWLLGWSHNEKWSVGDRAGVDFVVKTDRGNICINIKSSHFFAKQFENRHKGEDIVVMVVNVFERPETFLGKLISTIGAIHKKMSAWG